MKSAKSIGAAILLTFVAAEAVADWQPAYKTESYASYYDPLTIRRNGDLATLSQLRDLKTSGVLAQRRYRSQQAVLEYDCKRFQVRLRSLTLYAGPMGTGDVLQSDATAGEWKPVGAGSMNEEFLHIACKTRK